jgi:hypothetical protein
MQNKMRNNVLFIIIIIIILQLHDVVEMAITHRKI